jgi:hypothetical protein
MFFPALDLVDCDLSDNGEKDEFLIFPKKAFLSIESE